METQRMSYVFLVERETLTDVIDDDGKTEVTTELLAVCSTFEKAKEYVDMPNFDIVITRWTLDDPESETVVFGDWDSES